jgi:cytotoxic
VIYALNNNNRNSATREEALKQAEEKGVKKLGVTQSGRKIYINKNTGDLYSLDELHNTWEHIDNKGRHLGEVSSDFERLLDSADKTGKHNVDKKELQKLLNQKLK